MKQVRVEHLAGAPVGRIDVPDEWSVVVVANEGRAMASPPRDSFTRDGYQPNVLIRVEDAGVPEELPDSVLVLSDRTVGSELGEVRTRTTVSGGMGPPMMDLVINCRASDAMMSVICSSTQAQWADLAEQFDEVAESVRFEGAEEAVGPQ